MFYDHGFSVGLPDNLVHIEELLEVLKKRIKKYLL